SLCHISFTVIFRGANLYATERILWQSACLYYYDGVQLLLMVGLCEARFTQDKYRDIVNGSSGEYRRARRFQVSPRVRTTAQELTEEAFTVPELTSAQLSEEFPGNEWPVADIYEKYTADKSSVDEKWAEIFARLEAA